MRVSARRIDMDDKLLQKPVLQDYSEVLVSANSGTTYIIDLTTGNTFKITMTGNCTFTFSNPPISGTTGTDILTFVTTDAGTTWYGFAAGADMK